jgi:hypothetical protein
MAECITFGRTTVHPKTEVRVLGVHLDPSLKWGRHVNKIKEKMAKQTLALTRTTASTWGATFLKARHVYKAVIRPTMVFGHAVWHDPDKKSPSYASHQQQLKVIQNKCLRVVTGAYKATPTQVLEAEAGIPPIEIYLNQLQAQTRKRLSDSNQTRIIQEACRRIQENLQGKRGRRKVCKATPGQRKAQWASKVQDQAEALRRRSPRSEHPNQRSTRKDVLEDHFHSEWTREWEKYRQSIPPCRRSPAQADTDLGHRQKFHVGASKGESSLMVQIRTEKIGLRAFLALRQVPGYTPECECGEGIQTPKHVILTCSNTANNRPEWLWKIGTCDYKVLTSTTRGLRAVAQRLMELNLLPQFRLAREMVSPLAVS